MADSCKVLLAEETRLRGGVQGLGGDIEERRNGRQNSSIGSGDSMRPLPFADFLLSVGDSGYKSDGV